MSKKKERVTDGTPNPELPNMPELDTCGKLAVKLIQANDDIAEAHMKRDEAQEALIEALEGTGRSEIRVNGKIVSIKRIEAKTRIMIKSDDEPELM